MKLLEISPYCIPPSESGTLSITPNEFLNALKAIKRNKSVWKPTGTASLLSMLERGALLFCHHTCKISQSHFSIALYFLLIKFLLWIWKLSTLNLDSRGGRKWTRTINFSLRAPSMTVWYSGEIIRSENTQTELKSHNHQEFILEPLLGPFIFLRLSVISPGKWYKVGFNEVLSHLLLSLSFLF